MATKIELHTENPQMRFIKQAVSMIRDGAVFVYPTDSSYALGCRLGDKAAMMRIRQIRGVDENHHFTLVCRDLSEIATYAKVDNVQYRLLKAYTPGPYTFILSATRDLPRRVLHPKRKTIGLRIPAHVITQTLLQTLDEPLLSLSLQLPNIDVPISDLDVLSEGVIKQLDLLIDGGPCGVEGTSIIDLTQNPPVVLRQGKGDVSDFLN